MIIVIFKVLYIVLVLLRIINKFNFDMDKILLFLGIGIDFFINYID